jgi:hypothetical protein
MSNIIRAIRGILNHVFTFRFSGYFILGVDAFDWKDEITSWKKKPKKMLSFT